MEPGGPTIPVIMEAPPHAVYSSLEELTNQSNIHALGHGYKLVVVRSKTNAAGQKTWVQLACDRHGEYLLQCTRRRQALTLAT